MILQNDVKGSYILPTTKNVFLKQYSNDIENMMQWNENDMIDYADEIKGEIQNIDKLIEKYGTK